MDNAKLKELLDRIPWNILLVAAAAYFGWDLYWFSYNADSPLMQKQSQYDSARKENLAMEQKINQAKEFAQTLEQKRVELRVLARELDEMKATLSEDLDVPAFMKLVISEAAKVGLTVVSLKPEEPKNSEYYVEQPFILEFKAVFVQLLVFLQRLSSVERIVRVDNFDMKPDMPSTSAYVELAGKVQIKTYRYLGSKADEIAKPDAIGAPAKTAAPGGGAQAPAIAAPAAAASAPPAASLAPGAGGKR